MGSPRTVLVTGSSRGIGRDLSIHLLQSGDTVIGCARGEAQLSHERYRHFQTDVADEASVRNMFSSIASEFGRIDLVVNNAGLALSRLALLTSAVEFVSIIQVNLVGAFIVSREAIRLMKRTRFGRIVNFSSINVSLASSGGVAYNAAKAGLENMAVTLSRECAHDDITINSIGLSLVADSGMVEALNPTAIAEKQNALIKPNLIKIAEIVHAIEFFAAPDARNITGQTIYFGGVR
jgi:3-oxoacyl-[acyl-carrier protein] reductase